MELKKRKRNNQVGSITADHAKTDITNAIAMGLDAFALNLLGTETWSTDAVGDLFNATQGTNFKLFFSFDMTHFTSPSQFIPLLEQYVNHPNYYQYRSSSNGSLPFVSTYNGGTLTFGASDPNSGWTEYFRNNLTTDIFFVPDFDDAAGYPNGFFDTFSVVDGAFSWEIAWPNAGSGKVNVSDGVDSTMITQAHAAGKIYMMRMYKPTPPPPPIILLSRSNCRKPISYIYIPIQAHRLIPKLVPHR